MSLLRNRLKSATNIFPMNCDRVMFTGHAVQFKDVPADVCENCGEYYLSEEITGRLLERAEGAVQSGTEVEIVRFAA